MDLNILLFISNYKTSKKIGHVKFWRRGDFFVPILGRCSSLTYQK